MEYTKILSIVILYIFLAGPILAQQNYSVEGTVVDRSESAVRYFLSGLEVDEKDDPHAFSSSVAGPNGTMTSTLPSAITRLKKEGLALDRPYHFNVQELADDYYTIAKTYVGNGKFIVTMDKEKGVYTTGNRFEVADAYNKTFTWVTGTPSEAEMVQVTTNNFGPVDGTHAYIGITAETGGRVYEFDVNAATAAQGLKVGRGSIAAISQLEAVPDEWNLKK